MAVRLWHLANDGAVTWAEFAERAARQAGLNASLIEPCSLKSLHLAATRPRYSALAASMAPCFRPWTIRIARYVHARQRLGTAA